MQSMTDDTYKLNAELDSEYESKFEMMQAEYGHEGHGAVKATVYDLIDEAFDAHGLDLDADVATDDGDEEPLYNPFRHDESLTLDRDLLRDVLDEYDQPAIHPAHVSAGELPKAVAEKTQAVVAVARYRYLVEKGDPEWMPGTPADLRREVQNVLGDADERTVKKYLGNAYDRIREQGGVGRPDNVRPSDVFGSIESVDAWVEETLEMTETVGENPPAVFEARREKAAELWQWVAPHEGVQRTLDELDKAIDAATDGEEDAEENQSDDGDSGDDTEDEIADQLDAIAAAEGADTDDQPEDEDGDRYDEDELREAVESEGFDAASASED